MTEGGCCLLLLATVILGSTDLCAGREAIDGSIYLRPSEAVPVLGTYSLKTSAGKTCLKVSMGVQYIVSEIKRAWYFNLDPAMVTTSGSCGNDTAILSLTLPNNAVRLQLTVRKEGKTSYVTQIFTHISSLPVCNECASKNYSGILSDSRLFTTPIGWSFICSRSVSVLTAELKIMLVSLEMQAFTMPIGQYSKAVECWADYNSKVIPIIVGATVVGVCLIVMLTFLIDREQHRHGYESI